MPVRTIGQRPANAASCSSRASCPRPYSEIGQTGVDSVMADPTWPPTLPPPSWPGAGGRGGRSPESRGGRVQDVEKGLPGGAIGRDLGVLLATTPPPAHHTTAHSWGPARLRRRNAVARGGTSPRAEVRNATGAAPGRREKSGRAPRLDGSSDFEPRARHCRRSRPHQGLRTEGRETMKYRGLPMAIETATPRYRR